MCLQQLLPAAPIQEVMICFTLLTSQPRQRCWQAPSPSTLKLGRRQIKHMCWARKPCCSGRVPIQEREILKSQEMLTWKSHWHSRLSCPLPLCSQSQAVFSSEERHLSQDTSPFDPHCPPQGRALLPSCPCRRLFLPSEGSAQEVDVSFCCSFWQQREDFGKRGGQLCSVLCSLDEVQDFLLWKVGEIKDLPKPTSPMTATLESMKINGTMFREMTNLVFNQNNTQPYWCGLHFNAASHARKCFA